MGHVSRVVIYLQKLSAQDRQLWLNFVDTFCSIHACEFSACPKSPKYLIILSLTRQNGCYISQLCDGLLRKMHHRDAFNSLLPEHSSNIILKHFGRVQHQENRSDTTVPMLPTCHLGERERGGGGKL